MVIQGVLKPNLVAPVISTKTIHDIHSESMMESVILFHVILRVATAQINVENTPTAPASVGVNRPA